MMKLGENSYCPHTLAAFVAFVALAFGAALVAGAFLAGADAEADLTLVEAFFNGWRAGAGAAFLGAGAAAAFLGA